MSHTLYQANVQRVQRCELAVPGSNPGMFEKALKSGVDFIFLDLEDAVAPDDKLQARKMSSKRLMIWTGKVTALLYRYGLTVWIHSIWCVMSLIWLNRRAAKLIRF